MLSVYDSEQNYEVMTPMEHHSATITSVQFYQDSKNNLRLVSSGYDRTIVSKKVDFDLVKSMPDFEQLQMTPDIFTDDKRIQCSNKVISLDIQA